jgi:hypothetical protein
MFNNLHNSFHPSRPPNSNHANVDLSAGGYYNPPNLEQSYVHIYNEQPNFDPQNQFDSSPAQYATGQRASYAHLNNNNYIPSPSQSQVTLTQPQSQSFIYQATHSQSTHLATQPQSQPLQHRSSNSTWCGPIRPLPAPSQVNGSLARLLVNPTAHDPAPLNCVHRISTVNPEQAIPIQSHSSVAARVETATVNISEDTGDQSRSPSSYRPSVSPSPFNPCPSLPPPLPSPTLKRPAPPLIDINNRPNHRKKKKVEPVDRPRPSPRPYEELMKMSEGQLIMEAKKWSKKAMSDSDRAFFSHYSSEQRKMLTIKAIERCSMPIVFQVSNCIKSQSNR